MNSNKNSKPRAWAYVLRRAWLALKRTSAKRLTAPLATRDRPTLSFRLCELSFCFLPDEMRGSLVGDLEEEYRLRKAEFGRMRAALWLCRQILASQRQLRRIYPLLKGTIARLKPVAVKAKAHIQSHPLARRYRAVASHAAALLAFTLLAALALSRWSPASRQPDLAFVVPSKEQSSTPPRPEPYSKPDPTPSEANLTRETLARPRRAERRAPRPRPSVEYVSITLYPLELVRGPEQPENRIVSVRIPPASGRGGIVRFSLKLPEVNRPGLYSVKLIDAAGSTLFGAQLNCQNGKSCLMSAPSQIFSEGTYKLVASDDASLEITYRFRVTRGNGSGREAEVETPPADKETSPKPQAGEEASPRRTPEPV